MRAGIISSVIANVNRDSKRQPKPYAPSDFMPKFGEEKSKNNSGKRRPITDISEWNRLKGEAKVIMSGDH